MSNVCISRKSGPKRGPSRPTRAQPPKRGGHYHDDACNNQTGHHQHLEVQQVQQRWTMRNANGKDGWGKMYVFFGIIIIISYIFVLLQQEEDGAVAITLERHA